MRGPESREAPPVFEVREARIEDAERIAEIQRAAWLVTYPNDERGITKEYFEKNIATQEENARRWHARLTDGRPERTFLVEDAERVIGFCNVTKEKEHRVRSLYLDPAFKGRGAGARVFIKALEWLGDEKEIVLDVASYNERAIAFYRRFGFVETGEMGKILGPHLPIPLTTFRRPSGKHLE